MSDIRMQSIFLDEEFVLEDNSDVRLHNSKSRSVARAKSKMGHEEDKSRLGDKSNFDPKRSSSVRNIRSRNGRVANNAETKKAIDAENNGRAKYFERRSDRESEITHKGQAASRVKKESAIMDTIEII